MFRSIFESAIDVPKAAAMLAALTVTPQDQVAAFRGIMAPQNSFSIPLWSSNAAVEFIAASSFISSELVDAVLVDAQLKAWVALVYQHHLLSSEDLLRVVDSSDPFIVEAVEAEGLLGLVSAVRLEQLVSGSSVTADIVLQSDLVSVELLRAAIEGTYSFLQDVPPLSVPSYVFDNAVACLSLETVSEVVVSCPPSSWWVPLLACFEFTAEIVQQFFDAVFEQVSPSSAVANRHVEPLTDILDVVLAAIEVSGRFPDLFAVAASGDVLADMLRHRINSFQVHWLGPQQYALLVQRFADAVATGSPVQPAVPLREVSRWPELVTIVRDMSQPAMVAAWRTGALSTVDVAEFVAQDHTAAWKAVTALCNSLAKEPSFIQDLPVIYQTLLDLPDQSNSRVRHKLFVVAQLMPFEMQVAVLRLGHLSQVVDIRLLHEWRLARPWLTFEMFPAIVSSDAPLITLETVGALDETAD